MSGGEFLPTEPIRRPLTQQDINSVLIQYPLKQQLDKVLSEIQKAKEAGINFSKALGTGNNDKIMEEIGTMTIVAITELNNETGLKKLKTVTCSLNWDTDEQLVWVECKIVAQAFKGDENISYKATYMAPDGLEYDVLVKTSPVPAGEEAKMNLPQLLHEAIVYPPHQPNPFPGRMEMYDKLRLSKLSIDTDVEKQIKDVIDELAKSGISANKYKLRRMTEIAVDNLKTLMNKYKNQDVINNIQCKPFDKGKTVSCSAIIQNLPNDTFTSLIALPAMADNNLYVVIIYDEPWEDLYLRDLIVTVKEAPGKRFDKIPFDICDDVCGKKK